MSRQSRRQFLTKTAAASGALATTGLVGRRVLAADEPAEMCIARWKGEAVPEEKVDEMAARLVRQAMDGIGGMGRFVKTDFTVWVKPNMAWTRKPEQAANTNPGLVAELVKMCLEAGAKKVKVGDMTCHPAEEAYPASGIVEAVEKVGAEVVYVDNNRFRECEIGGKYLQKWEVYPDMIESDLVINCPIVKHHSLSTLTLCMKNYMGVVGGKRNAWHQDLSTCLADITQFMKPPLCVVDGVRILLRNGPTGGNLEDVKRMDTVAAGTDIVALDAFGATLLGHDPASIESVRAGAERGLGQMDYTKLALRELEVA